MKSMIAPLAGLGILAAATGAALAAPPAYCALYAREYANQFALAAGEKPDSEPKIQDEAYYRCLNLDQAPEMPTTSAYFGTSVDTAGQDGQQEPVTGSAAPDTNQPVPVTASAAAPAVSANADTAAAGASAPPAADTAAAPQPKPATRTADSTPSTHSYTGGKKPWSPEWLAACRKYFPHSFNEKDGTILPYGSNKRVLCK